MKVRVKVQTYWDAEIRKSLEKNPIREVMMEEHEHGSDEKYGFYLIHTGVERTGTFVSDLDVLSGRVIRTYKSPDLPLNYNKGPWMWINKNEGEKVLEVNKEAKFLLKKYEWSVE
jgi:hypothetical protein